MTQRDENKRSVDGNLGISRRDLLRRGAVVGGTVLWVTPVIQSMSRPAFAQATPREGCFCIKWDPNPQMGEPECEDINGQGPLCDELDPLTPAENTGGCGGVDFQENEDGSWTATLPPGCRFVEGCSKCGAIVDCNCAPQLGMEDGRVTATFFPCSDGAGGAISHIEFCYCCD